MQWAWISFVNWCRYDESGSQIETMAKTKVSPWRLWWRKIHSWGDHGERSSIVVDTENLNCPRLSLGSMNWAKYWKWCLKHLYFWSQSKNWRNSCSIFKISYTWNATVSVELPISNWIEIVERATEFYRMLYKSEEKVDKPIDYQNLRVEHEISEILEHETEVVLGKSKSSKVAGPD